MGAKWLSCLLLLTSLALCISSVQGQEETEECTPSEICLETERFRACVGKVFTISAKGPGIRDKKGSKGDSQGDSTEGDSLEENSSGESPGDSDQTQGSESESEVENVGRKKRQADGPKSKGKRGQGQGGQGEEGPGQGSQGQGGQGQGQGMGEGRGKKPKNSDSDDEDDSTSGEKGRGKGKNAGKGKGKMQERIKKWRERFSRRDAVKNFGKPLSITLLKLRVTKEDETFFDITPKWEVLICGNKTEFLTIGNNRVLVHNFKIRGNITGDGGGITGTVLMEYYVLLQNATVLGLQAKVADTKWNIKADFTCPGQADCQAYRDAQFDVMIDNKGENKEKCRGRSCNKRREENGAEFSSPDEMMVDGKSKQVEVEWEGNVASFTTSFGKIMDFDPMNVLSLDQATYEDMVDDVFVGVPPDEDTSSATRASLGSLCLTGVALSVLTWWTVL